jgi:hypothetical protein
MLLHCSAVLVVYVAATRDNNTGIGALGPPVELFSAQSEVRFGAGCCAKTPMAGRQLSCKRRESEACKCVVAKCVYICMYVYLNVW